MSREAELADGTILEFPDETSDDVIRQTVKRHLTGASTTVKPAPELSMRATHTGEPAPTPPPPSAGAEFKQWLTTLGKSITGTRVTTPEGYTIPDVLGNVKSAMNLLPTLLRPVTNLAMRYFDPTNALGGEVTHLMEGRPWASDPNAREGAEALIPMAIAPKFFMPGAELETGTLSAADIAGHLRSGRITTGQAIDSLQSLPGKPSLQAALEELAGMGRPPSVEEVDSAVKSGQLTYKQAQEFLADLPRRRAEWSRSRELELGNLKTTTEATGKGIQKESREATNQAVQSLEQTKAGLQSQNTALGRAQLSTQNTQGRTAAAQELRQLRTGKQAVPQVVANQELTKAQKLVSPTEVPTATMAAQSKVATDATIGAYQTRVGALYDSLRDDLFPKYTETRQVPVANNYSRSGVSVTQPQDVAMPVTGFKTAELAEEAQRINAGSEITGQALTPGERMLQSIVDAPDTMTGDQALMALRQANKLGYGKVDPKVVTSNDQRLARMVSHSLHNALYTSIQQVMSPEDADLAISTLNQAKVLLTDQSALINTPAARAARRSIERWGNVNALRKDPMGFRAWWNQVDDPATQEMAQQQLLRGIVGDSYEKFSTNWTTTPNEVKSVAFTPEQRAVLDKAAQEGPAAIQQLTTNYDAQMEQVRRGVEARTLRLASERERLAGVTDQIKTVNDQIRTTKAEAKPVLQAQLDTLTQQATTQKEAIKALYHQQKLDTIALTSHAQAKVQHINNMKRLGWMGLAGVGMYHSRYIFQAISNAITSP